MENRTARSYIPFWIALGSCVAGFLWVFTSISDIEARAAELDGANRRPITPYVRIASSKPTSSPAPTSSVSAPVVDQVAESHAVFIGQVRRVVASAGASFVPFATSKDLYDRFIRATATHNQEEWAELLLDDGMLALEPDARVRVIGASVFSVQVKVLEGRCSGAIGWLPNEKVGG